MKVAIFDTHEFERKFFEKSNQDYGYELTFFSFRLTEETARLAKGFQVICAFVNDRLNLNTLNLLREAGVQLIALRSAGFNHVDLVASEKLGFKVVRVPEYSPFAVAEHTVGLILSLNRKIHRAYARVREGNFSLDGLVGFDLHGKTMGIVGTGRIGAVIAKIMTGFGCKVLAYDVHCNKDLSRNLGVVYVSLDELFSKSDIISLNIPLTPATRHLINEGAISKMKKGVMIINTGRGALIESRALISALKTGHIGSAGLDVYEEEENVFFRDLSEQILQDDVLARLLTFPNVLITAHQAFLTQEALVNIVETTFNNIHEFKLGKVLTNEVKAVQVLKAN